MSAYGYGPPPPPPPAQSPGGYGQQYQPSYADPSHGDHSRRGRGGGYYSRGRGSGVASGGDRRDLSGYGHASQQYGSGRAQGGYAPAPPPPQQPQGQQHWAPAPNPAAQGYNPSYAPHMFSQQPPPPLHSQPPSQHQHHLPLQAPADPYGQQVAYGGPNVPTPQQPYGHQYHHPGQPASGPPGPSWPQQSSGHHHSSGQYGGRGGRGGGAAKAQMMGPPIRIGFDGAASQGPAPVSSGYLVPPPGVPYGTPTPTPGPVPAGYSPPAPYPPYPPSGPPQQYAPYYNQNNRYQGGRGGYQGKSVRGGRPYFNGDKMRHHNKRPGGNNHYGGGSVGGDNNSAPTVPHQKPDTAAAVKKKKRKTNTLGLTPGEESDIDEVDEEAQLVEMIGPDAPNPVDIDSWIAERRRNFPTQARVQAKLAKWGNVTVQPNGDAVAATAKVKAEEGTVDGASDSARGKGSSAAVLTALERQQLKAEKLRKQLEKVESSIKRKREQQDEGDEMRGVEGDAGGDDLSGVSSLGDKSDDDAPPESKPIRKETAKTQSVAEAAAAAAKSNIIPPAAKKADPTKHCKYYSTGGTCGKKGKCRFVHDPAVREAALLERERNGGRLTLQQRLILNDKDQEDLTIVKTLQYLKEKGMMRDCPPPLVAPTKTTSTGPPSAAPASPTAVAKKKADATSTVVVSMVTDAETGKGTSHSPPIPTNSPNDLSVVPPVVAEPGAGSNGASAQYQGWDLSGFGNSGAKSDDP